MFTSQQMSYSFGDGTVLFQNLSFHLEKGQKYALVGPNGVGKSTLASLIAGLLEPSHGRLIASERPVYFSQFESRPEVTLAEYIAPLWEEDLLDFQFVDELLAGLEMSLPLSQLSGGEWMRARLAKHLGSQTHFVILDEPTNNLDREGREVLLHLVQEYPAGLLVISHDRELLELVDETWELSNQGLEVYGGPYSFYHEQKQAQLTRQGEELDRARLSLKRQGIGEDEKVRRQLKRMQVGKRKADKGGIPRIVAGGLKRKAQQSLNRVRVNEKERTEKKQEHFKTVFQSQKVQAHIRLTEPIASTNTGGFAFVLEDFNFRYSNTSRFLWSPSLHFSLKKTERLVIRGLNGSGKSTLLKVLLGQELAGQSQGSVQVAKGRWVYLDQNYSSLNLEKNVLENLCDYCDLDEVSLRNKLADYHFTKEKVFQQVETLSGGEKLRVVLAQIFLSRQSVDVLILDEPTNNLDLDSIEILEGLLRDFTGTLIVVSHDKHFIENIQCGQVLELCHQKMG